MNPVVHFEMPYENAERMAQFYTTAFGWQTQALGAEMGHYVLATTTESNDQGRPKAPGTINGGFYARRPDNPAPAPCLVIAVPDIEETMRNVVAAGGKMLGEPMDIPGVGRYVSFLDTEKNRVSMLEPLPRG